MASILEVAARNELLKNAGHHAAREFFNNLEGALLSERTRDESEAPPPVKASPPIPGAPPIPRPGSVTMPTVRSMSTRYVAPPPESQASGPNPRRG
jgi:HPr kinase/phosphorylase